MPANTFNDLFRFNLAVDGDAAITCLFSVMIFAEIPFGAKLLMGQVMKLVQERAAGRADGKALSQAVMAKLS